MKRSAAPLLVSVLVLAGCGGGSDGTTTGTAARSPATTAATSPTVATPDTTAGGASTTTGQATTAAPAGTDAKIATDGLLRPGDLPANWTDKHDGGGKDQDAPCPAIQSAKKAVTARAKSDTFASGDATINSVVYLYATPQEAQQHLDDITTDATKSCLAKAVVKPVEDAAKQQGARLGRLQTDSPTMTGGDDARAFRLALRVTQDGRTDDVTVSIGSTRVGRGLALLSLVGLNDQAQQQLTTASVRRLTDALAVGP